MLCLLVFALASSCASASEISARTSAASTSPSPTSSLLPAGSSDSRVGDSTPAVPLAASTSLPSGSAGALPLVLQTDLAGGTPTPVGSDINPLTGELPQKPALLDRRPLVIKISNYPREIRPQYGLNEADVVFEYYIEWLDTRFIGIFYGNDARQIGPVRSGRYFDEHILRMYHAYYVFNFADEFKEMPYFLGGDLQKWLVVPGYGNCPPFFTYRVSETITDVKHYETYFDSSRFGDCLAAQAGDNTRPALRSGFFSALAPSMGAAVNRIFTHYSRCDYNYWAYDPASRQYLRYQETSPDRTPGHLDDCSDSPETYAPLSDALVDEQVSADNVVVIFVSHTFASEGEQQDEVYHINLVDSGRAFVFRDGLGIPARWVRTDIDQPLLITTETGEPLSLRPGRTFFEVIGETSTAWSDGLDWHFDFQTP